LPEELELELEDELEPLRPELDELEELLELELELDEELELDDELELDEELELLELEEEDPLVYIYFTVFEICGWIKIHYNKRIESATFHFVKDGELWSLAGIESAKIKIL
jgi:hypothetical protein